MKSLAPFIFTIMLALFLSSCEDPKDYLDLDFKLEYDGAPMVMFQDYIYHGGNKIQLQRVSFYLSDLRVQDELGGPSTLISEAEYIDLTQSHLDEASAREGFNYLQTNIGTEDYELVSFNIGLTKAQNATLPEEYNSSNALSLSSEYWRDWGSYIFFKIEGSYDKNGDGAYGPGEAFGLHLGTDNSMNQYSFDIEDSEANVIIEMKDVFQYGGVTYDLANRARLHNLTPEVIEAIDFLATGIGGAVSANQ